MFHTTRLFNKFRSDASLFLFKQKLTIGNYDEFKLRINRSETISNYLVGNTIFVHQGRVWVKVRVTKYHVGLKAGMLAATKKPFYFRQKKKKNKRDSRR